MTPTCAREAALLHVGDDSACTEAAVSHWPQAAVQTINALLGEARENERAATPFQVRTGLKLWGLVEDAAARGEPWAGPLLHAAKTPIEGGTP